MNTWFVILAWCGNTIWYRCSGTSSFILWTWFGTSVLGSGSLLWERSQPN